jgi:hypothetical protein
MPVRGSVCSAIGLLLCSAHAFAQQQNPASEQGGVPMPMPPGQTPHMMAMPENPLGIDHTRDGSGTSWLPDASPMQGLMRQRGDWILMVHGNAFVEFIDTGSDRGDHQFGSVNWIMGMAQHEVGGGPLQFRGMFSLEPLTVGRCGYPNLLQSGEFCNGVALHDRQHPHDLFMEVAADYRRAINNSIAFELYGGPSGEPALGPTAFAHRLSALPNPIAPVSHHWLDSSHISFGVVTGGVYGRTWKAEASVFNGREPDDRRYNFDLAALDSYSGRLWWLPTAQWALQVSAGHLKETESRATGPREDVDRVTASATYHRLVNDRVWATTIAWGQNREAGRSTPALAIETAADLSTTDTAFARGELVSKTPAELVLPLNDDQTFAVSKLQVGYTRWFAESRGMKAGLGGSVGLSIVPETLKSFYGGRSAGEFSVFLTVRPH